MAALKSRHDIDLGRSISTVVKCGRRVTRRFVGLYIATLFIVWQIVNFVPCDLSLTRLSSSAAR
jgi:hypothetical protein